MDKKLWVTTIDNPFDPFTQFDDWYSFDEDHGYHTCAYIARIANLTSETSEKLNDEAINDAVTDIARLNVLGIYKLVEEKAEK